MLANVGNGPLAPVTAAQSGFSTEVCALCMEVILLPGIGGIVDQKSFIVFTGLIDAVFQRTSVERHIAVDQLGGFLCKGILRLLQGSSFLGTEVRPPGKLHLNAVCLVAQAIGLVENRLAHPLSSPLHENAAAAVPGCRRPPPPCSRYEFSRGQHTRPRSGCGQRRR